MHSCGYFTLIVLNTPTIETFQNPYEMKRYDAGCINNIKEIYPNIFLFFVPTRPKIDPYYWNNTQTTQTSQTV